MSNANGTTKAQKDPKFKLAESHDLSPRQKWLRDYYFKGVEREWNAEYMAFTTGTDWDIIWNEADGSGSLRVPDYNDGVRACWDTNQFDVECPGTAADFLALR